MTKAPQSIARKTCLVVDDSRAVRKVARRILEELRFSVVEAADGKLAIEHCLAAMPDAVLLDWSMPVMSGIEFLRQLRRTPGGEVPVVLFCTSHGDLDHIQEALVAGANEYLLKPFDGEILQAKLTDTGVL
jgi:two-component system chemotaxis response regulator CheY